MLLVAVVAYTQAASFPEGELSLLSDCLFLVLRLMPVVS
jgi:hypothetical protein